MMHDMNNNNPNKYYYKPYHPMAANQHNRSHHPGNVYDNQRNDYFNGPYMGPPPPPPSMVNNQMIPSGGYNHFTNPYHPPAGNGPFYRDFRQNWQPQPQMIQPQQLQHRQSMVSQPQSQPQPQQPQPQQPQQLQQQQPPPPTSTSSSISKGQSSSSLSSSLPSSLSSSSSSNATSRNFSSSSTTIITTTPSVSSSFSSSSSSSHHSRHGRSSDEHTLVKLKQQLARTMEELEDIQTRKSKLELEEERIQKILDKTKSEVDRLESRLRDPRVKNRPENHNHNHSDHSILAPSTLDKQPLPRSSFSPTVPSLTSLTTTTVTSILSTSVPTCSVQNITTSESGLTYSSLLTSTSTPSPLSNQVHSLLTSHSTTTIHPPPSVPTALLVPPLPTLNTVPNTNNSRRGTPNSSQLCGQIIPSLPQFPGQASSILAPPTTRSFNKISTSRGKQLNNLVQFKSLPMVFDIFPEEILKPEIFPSHQTKVKLNFSFKPNQLELFQRNPSHRVLLRICHFKVKKTSQSDRVSRKLLIKINGRPFPLGKQANGSIKAPLDITQYCTDLRNDLELCWPENEPGRDYGIGIFINQRFPSDHALQTLKQGPDYQRPSTEALKMIAKNFAASGDICSEEIMVPLCCPITKKRLEIPAIGLKCEHLACFDAKSFLDINSKRSEWHCPSCKKAIGFNDLRIDCLIVEILSKTPADCLKVSFDRNGTWNPVIEKEKKESIPTLIDVNKIDIITLDDSDEENLKDENFDSPNNVSLGEARMDLETEQEDETEQEEEDDELTEEGDDDEEEEEEGEEGEIDSDDETEEDEDTDEEGEITDKGQRGHHGRCEKSRRYEDDPDFVYSGSDSNKSASPNGGEASSSNDGTDHPMNDTTLDEEIRPPSNSRERRKKQFSEIFGSDSRENSPDSSVQSPVRRCNKRRKERVRRCVRKRRHD